MIRKTLVCLALLFVACGTDSEQAQEPVESAPASTAAAPSTKCSNRTPEAPPSENGPGEDKPEVEVPDGDPPCKLVVQDIYKGEGPEAKAGATVTVHYVGVSWSTGEQFDASWDGGNPVPLSLSQVIQGWQQGIPGMMEGGRRRLIIPPELAYGASPPPGIAPNETLIFVIDLVAAE